MTAPTIAVEWLLARAAMRSTGLLHVVSRRDSGALNPVCGANPIRSEKIETHHRLDDVATLCPGCGTMAASIGGTVIDGVALLLGLSEATATVRLLDIPVTSVYAHRDHARRSPGTDVDALVESVTERGIVTPLIVRRTGHTFEVIDGARRLYAAHVAGLTTVPAIVRDVTDSDALLDSLTANLHRADLNPIEQATAYTRALEQLQISKAELGRRLGISREAISNTIRLLDLPAGVQEQIADGTLTATDGRAILAGATPKPNPLQRPQLAATEVALLADLGAALAGLLDARVKVTPVPGDKRRITIDVPQDDLARILGQLGIQAAAA